MSVTKVVSEGLAHFSYFMANEGTAAVIDPRRDCDVYLDLARKAGVRITRIFETHRNEDYAIGSLELFERTGAEILHGPRPDWGYGTTLKDGQRFHLGGISFWPCIRQVIPTKACHSFSTTRPDRMPWPSSPATLSLPARWAGPIC